jgi:hypothetical protein
MPYVYTTIYFFSLFTTSTLTWRWPSTAEICRKPNKYETWTVVFWRTLLPTFETDFYTTQCDMNTVGNINIRNICPQSSLRHFPSSRLDANRVIASRINCSVMWAIVSAAERWDSCLNCKQKITNRWKNIGICETVACMWKWGEDCVSVFQKTKQQDDYLFSNIAMICYIC